MESSTQEQLRKLFKMLKSYSVLRPRYSAKRGSLQVGRKIRGAQFVMCLVAIG